MKFKKTIIDLCLFIPLFLITGCSIKNNVFSNELNPVDSEIDYILFRDKKIYLTNNLEDFVLQFKGYGCKFQAKGSNISDSFEIDNIDSKNHAFYTLTGGYKFEIECFVDGNVSNASFDGYLNQKEDTYYTDREIETWRITSLEEVIKVKTKNNGTLLFGDDSNHETIDSIKKKFGEPTDLSTDYSGRTEYLIYEVQNYKYEFIVSNSMPVSQGTEVYGFYMEVMN